jgi:uncharacterized membrane protein YhaH (DUF805 family)
MTSRSNIYKQLNSGNLLFPYRIGRVEYFVRGLILGLLVAFPSTLADRTENPFLLLFCGVLLLVIGVAAFWIQIIPRMRDLKWNTKLAWLMLVPGVNIIMGVGLLFMPPK